jgi:hypothetical protein
MKYRQSDWQKSFRSIPDFINIKLKNISSSQVRVEAVKNIAIDDIIKNKYIHLGIVFSEQTLVFEKEIIPDNTNGYASNYNKKTKVIVRKNLPKFSKTYSWESPNFGDWSKGSHDVSRTIDVYQRLYYEPLFLSIIIEKIAMTDKEIGFKFSINRLLDRSNKNFEIDLLRDLNLLQENCGICDIYDPSAESTDYLKDLQINWEILPPGTKDEVIQSYFKGIPFTESERREVGERLDVVLHLKPEAYIKGTSGMQRYFGAMFNESLVAFENLKYGNAIYIMQEKWADLSKMSRIELMKYHSGEIIRIIHRRGWERQFEYIINKLKEKKC